MKESIYFKFPVKCDYCPRTPDFRQRHGEHISYVCYHDMTDEADSTLDIPKDWAGKECTWEL